MKAIVGYLGVVTDVLLADESLYRDVARVPPTPRILIVSHFAKLDIRYDDPVTHQIFPSQDGVPALHGEAC